MIFWMNILGALGFITFQLGILISSFSYDFLWGIIFIPIFVFCGIKWIGSSYYDLDLNYKKFVSGRKLKTNENAYIIYSRCSILFGQNHNFCRCLLTVREIASHGVSLFSLTLLG